MSRRFWKQQRHFATAETCAPGSCLDVPIRCSGAGREGWLPVEAVKRKSCSMSCKLYSILVNTSTLTIRLPMEQREALKRSAKALKKTESEFIRDLLARSLDVRTMGERVGHLAGSIDSSKRTSRAGDSFRETIRTHNWRPNEP